MGTIPNSYEPIAIVGAACRLPGGVSSPTDLWELLIEGKDAHSPAPASRFNSAIFQHPEQQRRGTIVSSNGYFLETDPRLFDHGFFSISPLEARNMDPQQRQILEVAYESVESAGMTLASVSGSRTGCFVGNFTADYLRMRSRDPEENSTYSLTGESVTLLSNRISYCLNLQGPSLTLDTACSSSLYALHLAIMSLQLGESDMALVAGVNLLLTVDQYISSTKTGVLSPTSSCHTFDAGADGYARAEGVGALFIKPLKAALHSGDPIRAIIRGSAINSNGRTAGVTQPSSQAQERVIREAYTKANIEPWQRLEGLVFECHGTGTPVGDPIEVSAISQALETRSAERPLMIGSVKTSLGHSEACSGMTSILKMMVGMQKGFIPPTINVQRLNPKLELESLNLKVTTEAMPWPSSASGVKRASINSFGYGGANSHIILEAPQPSRAPSPRNSSRLYILPFSAHTSYSLKALSERCRQVLAQRWGQCHVDVVAHVLSSRRTRFAERGFAILDLQQDKLAISEDEYATMTGCGLNNIAFVFTGQGAQWPGMGAGLLRDSPVFRKSIRKLDQVLSKMKDPPAWSIEEALLKPNGSNEVDTPTLAQTLTTAIQIALIDLLKSWNVNPIAAVGHSSGEIAASYCAGFLTAAEAIRTAYIRGIVVCGGRVDGAMLAVGVGEMRAVEILDSLGSKATVACINSPDSVTLSGPEKEIDRLKEHLDGDGIFNRVLRTQGKAYHSWYMHELGHNYEGKLEDVGQSPSQRFHKAIQSISKVFCGPFMGNLGIADRDVGSSPETKVPMFSSLRGRRLELHESPTPAYWRDNLESPVLFDRAVSELLSVDAEIGVEAFLEIGPHGALETPLRQITQDVRYFPTLRRNRDSSEDMYRLAGKLFNQGYPIDLDRVNNLRIVPSSSSLVEALDILPSYPWDYDGGKILWEESRLSTEWRFRTHARHELLGSRLPGCAHNSPIWRNILKLTEIPWLTGHKLDDTIVFPAAGYVVIALEASKQESSSTRFALRNVMFREALVIPGDNSPVEIVTQFNKVPSRTSKVKSTTYEFTISTVKDKIWTENCTGTIIALSGALKTDPPPKECLVHSGSDSAWYEAFRKVGLNYGVDFALLGDVRSTITSGGVSAVVSLTAADRSEYNIHPTEIDACFQTCLVANASGRIRGLKKGYVPLSVEEVIINTAITPVPRGKYLAASSIKSRGHRKSTFDCELYDEGFTVVKMSGVTCVVYGGSSHTKLESDRNPYIRAVWKPGFTFLGKENAIRLFPPSQATSLSTILPKLERLCQLCIHQIHSRGLLGVSPSIPHIRRFLRWISNHRIALDNEGNKEITQLIEELSASAYEARIVQLVYENFTAIASGRASSLDVLLENDDLSRLYERGIGSIGAYQQLERVIDLLAHENPRMKILELGAGTGGATKVALEVLEAREPMQRFASYTYTDISAGFLGTAKYRFHDLRRLEFRTLDIELDTESQGYTPGSFDLIIAANVIHATRNIDKSLRNAYSLLKEGGKLILLEVTRDSVLPGFMLGSLPGYWHDFEDGRSDTPFLPKDAWHTKLISSGFSGLDHTFDDYPENIRLTSVLISTKHPATKPSLLFPKRQLLVFRNAPCATLKLYQSHRALYGESLEIACLEDITNGTSRYDHVVFFIDLEETTSLRKLSAEELSSLQRVVTATKSILWITSAGMLDGERPEQAMVAGIARTVMSEQPSTRFITLDLEPNCLCNEREVIRAITLVQDTEHPDTEFAFKDGMLHVNRLLSDQKLNSQFRSKDTPQEPKKIVLAKDTAVSLDMDTLEVGLIDSITFTESIQSEFLEPEEVEVRTHCLGVNMKDVLQFLGNIDGQYFSQEIVGVVTRTGSSVPSSRLSPGDRVVGLFNGTYGTLQRGHYRLCFKLAPQEKSGEVASLPIVYATTICALENIARVRAGESVLIHSAAGGVGIAAIHYCKFVGAEIYATVGNSEKREFLATEFGIPSERIFSSRDKSFGEALLKETDGRGVDVALSSVTGEMFDETWRSMAPFGRFIDIARRDVLENRKLNTSTFGGQAIFTSLDLKQLIETKPKLVSRLMERTLELYRSGSIKAIHPINSFDIGELPKCLRYFMRGTHVGKVIVKYEIGKSLMQVRPRHTRMQFHPNSTYLLVGCLGGLGRSLSTWMVERGACDFLFLGRSGAEKPEAIELVSELKGLGCTVEVVKGDVANEGDVQRAIHQARYPIRGVVQAAMVLRDGLFVDMTHKDFTSVLAPKVDGTVNLHNATLGAPLDFFVMTSSLSGTLGTVTQSNYCAANSFLDAFARFRRSRGLVATSLSLGMVTGVGYVAENPDVMVALSRNGFYGIDEGEFLHALELSMRNDHQLSVVRGHKYDPMASSFVLTGLEPFKLIELAKQGFQGGTFWNKDIRLANILGALEDADSGVEYAIDGRSNALERLRLAFESGDNESFGEMVVEAVTERLSGLLLVDREKLKVGARRLSELGMDSMIGAELRNWFYKELSIDVPFLGILDPGLTISGLCAEVEKAIHTQLASENSR